MVGKETSLGLISLDIRCRFAMTFYNIFKSKKEVLSVENVMISDSMRQQVELGKEWEKKKTEHYTSSVKRYIKDAIISSAAYSGDIDELYYSSIYHFWVYGVNTKEFLFYDFKNKNHNQKKQYLSYKSRDDYYFHMNDIAASHILNDKYETYVRYKDYYRRDVVRIGDENDYDAFCEFVEKHPRCVYKPSCMGLGAGVDLISFEGKKDLKREFERIIRRGKVIKGMNPWRGFEDIDSSVLEELIIEDERINRLHPHSINCLRIPSVQAGDRTVIFHPYIKMGRSNNFLVDERVGSILAGIDEKTGELNTDGFDENGFKYTEHPDTGVIIKGFQIPRWDELVELTNTLAKDIATEGITYVGWDFALTPDGWSVVEGNFDGEFLGQLVCEAGHADELSEIINWKPKKQFWWQ